MTDVPGDALFHWLAGTVLALHVGVVLFVVGGLALIVGGNLRGWRWVNAPAFRVAHLGAIGYVAAEAWLGIACPLTTLEMWLRARAGGATYAGGFVEHWVHRLLYWDAPPWVFVALYTAFLLAVAAAWWYFPPHFNRRRSIE